MKTLFDMQKSFQYNFCIDTDIDIHQVHKMGDCYDL